MCIFCRSLFVPFVFFLLVIVLSVLRFTDSDYLFGIFKLFLTYIRWEQATIWWVFNHICLYWRQDEKDNTQEDIYFTCSLPRTCLR